MEYIERAGAALVQAALRRKKSVLLLGPRQTGKTTLLKRLKSDLFVTLMEPSERQRYEKNPGILKSEVASLKPRNGDRPLVVLDEIQKAPILLDVIQGLIDQSKASFVLTGSSARKLRRGADVNLLPGRVVAIRLDPLHLREDPSRGLENRLLYGDLPGITQIRSPKDKETDLASYVTTYLEEEIRAESIVRNLASFARFLELAAAESGQIINLRKLSQEIGVAHTTIADYYQILDDCLIAERVESYSESKTRKKLTKTPRYLLFDLGVRRLAANEGTRPPKDRWGQLFEQWVGLELIRLSRNKVPHPTLRFWRDPDGPEVDWVLQSDGRLTPIEVKWSTAPSLRDTRHLEVFLREYPAAKRGYIICQTPRRFKLSASFEAIPWQDLPSLID